MPANERQVEFIETITKTVILMIQSEHSRFEISKYLKTLGFSEQQSLELIEMIVDAHGLEAPGGHGGKSLWLRTAAAETGMFAAAAGLTFAAAAIVSIILGAMGQALDIIGLGAISDVMVKMGEMLAGAGLGALATGMASESNSMGVTIGIWVGVIIYYLWILGLLEWVPGLLQG